MNIKYPCQYCINRYVTEKDGKTVSCHSECDLYKKWKVELDQLNKKLKEKRDIDRASWCKKGFNER